MSDLMVVERARELLADAHRVDEVKDVRDKAEAMRRYLRQRGASVESINYCVEIKARAERRTGEITAALPKAAPASVAATGGKGKAARSGHRTKQDVASVVVETKAAALETAGITKQRAAEYEAIAKIPAAKFEAAIAQARDAANAKGEAMTTAAIVAAATHTSGADDYDGDEWYTPPDVLDLVRLALGTIDLDPASNAHAQKTVQAGAFFTKKDNGLTQPWSGRVFCNPPYSNPLIEQFTTKLVEEYEAKRTKAAVYLVNNATDTAWFHLLLSQYPVCFTRGRISFLTRTGQKFGNRQGQAIFYLGSASARFRKVFTALGQVVAP